MAVSIDDASADLDGFYKSNADDDTKKSDLIQGGLSIFGRLNLKVAIIIFIIGCIIFSDIFQEGILKRINSDFVEGNYVTSGGTAIQLVTLSFVYLLTDLLVQYRII